MRILATLVWVQICSTPCRHSAPRWKYDNRSSHLRARHPLARGRALTSRYFYPPPSHTTPPTRSATAWLRRGHRRASGTPGIARSSWERRGFVGERGPECALCPCRGSLPAIPPSSAKDACAQRFITDFGLRTVRPPITAEEKTRYFALYTTGKDWRRLRRRHRARARGPAPIAASFTVSKKACRRARPIR
jgi:hypothetical protein